MIVINPFFINCHLKKHLVSLPPALFLGHTHLYSSKEVFHEQQISSPITLLFHRGPNRPIMASFITKIFRLIIVFCNLRYRLQRIRLLLQSAQISTLRCNLIVGYLINFDLQGQPAPLVRPILICGSENRLIN